MTSQMIITLLLLCYIMFNMFLITQAKNTQKDRALNIFNSAHKIHIPDYVGQSASIFDEIFAHDSVFFLKQDSQYIGFYAYRIRLNHAVLSALYVIAPYQRQGIGAYLLNDCEIKLKYKRINVLLTSALKRSIWALNFYKKQHFNVYDKTAPYFIRNIAQNYPDEPWAFLLYKKLI